MDNVPEHIVEQANKVISEGRCTACIDEMDCACFYAIAAALEAAEKRGEERERDRAVRIVCETQIQAENFLAGVAMGGADSWSARGAISACRDITNRLRSGS